MKTFFGRVIAVVAGIVLFFILCFIIISMLGAVFGGSDVVKVENGSVLKIDLKEPIMESNMEFETSLFNIDEEPNPHLLTLLKAIEKAETDDDIQGISLELDMTEPEEISQIELLRSKIEAFKKSGKFVYAYTNRASQSNYYLATVADSIFHNPMGNIELKGLSSQVAFFKNLGEKYGIEFEIIRHGDYKAAVEPFMRENLSEENKEQLTQIITQIWDEMAKKMATSRRIPVAQFNQYTDSLVAFMPQDALRNKLVDVIAHESTYHDFLKTQLNIDKEDELKEIELIEYAQTVKKNYDSDKIAILYAQGMITPGDENYGIQSETYKDAIQEIADEDDIKAVVLRINSGGGDANTSEEILHELKKLHADIPVVVSFGEVAGSGGYYIAMESDKIFSEPYTITGSIGVLGMIPNAKGFLNNIGITEDHVQTNANSVYYTPFEGLTPQGKETITHSTETVYEQFVNHVAANRKMTYDQVDALGGGRIYTGMEAKKLGLVDELGTLEDALAFAAEKADLEDYQIKSYPKVETGIAALLKEMDASAEVKNQIKNSLDPSMAEAYMKIEALRKLNGVQMLWPYDLKLE